MSIPITTDGLIFGIYPGSGVSLDAGSGLIKGKPDDPGKIKTALTDLAGNQPFLVRGYLQYVGKGTGIHLTPVGIRSYCHNNLQLDLALCYRTHDNDMDDWRQFIRQTIAEFADILVKIQITEEPNNPDITSGGDGGFLNVKQAIIEGVLAAKEEIERLGLSIQVGFNAVISFNPQDSFWSDVKALSTPEFTSALDYIGLDFYPGVFRPLPPGVDMGQAVNAVLHHYRHQNLAEGGIPAHLPLHITENGWPTNASRTEEQQAEAVTTILDMIYTLRKELHITHYEFFDLRDADTTGQFEGGGLETSGNGFQFGLMRDDYTPKPAYFVFKNLIEKYH